MPMLPQSRRDKNLWAFDIYEDMVSDGLMHKDMPKTIK